MAVIKIGLGTALILCVAASWPASALSGFQEKADPKKAGAPKRRRRFQFGRLEHQLRKRKAASRRRKSRIERTRTLCRDLDSHIEVKSDGQATFHSVPACRVVLKILIPGMDTGIVQVDVTKYKDRPVRIQIKSSGQP